MAGKMYKVRFCRKGEKPGYVRYHTKSDAMRAVDFHAGDDSIVVKYVGPVTVVATADDEWREVRKR